ncbi:hypothetical protein NADE_000775 [Nannochloris sp. 'desiccata']|nr:hypothetical protein KSW81_003713 [Chlorella desiccata (nom. nud.)]KAH7615938.1 hypothetical protein NADE_000775 [Chlorella desiccata (nom. nud.)]
MRALRTHIMTHPNDYIAYDLRCLCAMHCNDYSLALSDAIQCTTLNPAWARGWARLGAAQLCLGHPTAAASAYTQGLTLDPKNEEMLTGMELAKRAGNIRGGNNRRAAIHDGDS